MSEPDFVQGSGFRICGAVLRQRVSQSRKVAFLTIEVARQRSTVKLDVRTFSRSMIGEIEALGVGELVQVTGSIDIEAIRDRQGHDVKVDGYVKWVPVLTVKELKVQGGLARTADEQPDSAPDEDGVPF